MNNALLYIGGILVVALSALFAVPYFVDWNSYRGVFEEEATRIMGREVRVGGDVNLRLLPAPYVSFEKLKIADAGDEGGESFFRAESFTMWLSVPPLLKGVLEAKKVELKQPMLKLVANADGGGNWQSLSLSPGLMPFVPKDLMLQSVALVDGTITLRGPEQSELARVEGINGELVADALYGPYKFVGGMSWQGKPRSVRFATSEADAAGSIRFKTSVRALDSGNSYVLGGRITDLKAQPRIEGDLTALVRLQLGSTDEADTAAAEPAQVTPEDVVEGAGTTPEAIDDIPARPALLPETAAKGGQPFELRTKITGNTNGFELSDLNMSLDQAGAPQIVTGGAKLDWSKKLMLDVTLASRWLDLDRIAARDEGVAVPIDAAKGFFEALFHNLPEEADTNASLVLDQVTLGGEALSGVRVSATRSGGPLELTGLKAGLPGGARLDLEGVIEGGAKARSFEGLLSVNGPSLSRFLDWALKQSRVVQGRAEGSFALEGRLNLASKSIELREATAELAGMPLTGDIKIGLEKRKKVAVSIEGHSIDLGNLWPGSLHAAHLSELAGQRTETPAGEASEATSTVGWLSASDLDLNLRLRAAEVIDGERRLKDVNADVSIVGGTLSMPVLRFTASNGLSVDLEGSAADITGSPKGTVRGTIVAPTEAAAVALAEFVGLDEADSRRTAALAPLRVAGSLETGKRSATSSDLKLDGLAAGGRLRGEALLDGGWGSWHFAPADLTLSLDSPAAGRVALALLNAPHSGSPPTEPDSSGRLLFKAAGTAAEGLIALGVLEADGLELEYNGTVRTHPTEAHRISGELAVRKGDTDRVMALLGVPLGAGVATDMQGSIGLAASGDTLTLEPRQLTIGGSHVKGRLSVTKSEGASYAFDGDLDVDSATVPGLLSVLLDEAQPAILDEALAESTAKTPEGKARKAPAGDPLPVEEAASSWPEQSFDAAVFANLDGRLTARFGTLALEPGLAMRDAVLEARLKPGRLEVTRLAARGMGGRIQSSFAIDKAAAGATLSGKVAIDMASQDAPAGAADDTPGDIASFRLEMSGRALGPAALVQSLSGKGELTVGNVTLEGNTPKSVARVAEAALQGKGANSGDELAEALKAALKEGSLPLGSLKIPVTLADGNLKLDPVKIQTADGNSSFRSVVELSTLRIDSEWQIEPKITRSLPQPAASGEESSAASSAQKPAEARMLLPALSVAYVGKLRDLGSLEPIIATAALERELSVRKMERDVDELERLRRQDQARAKADLERQKAIEAERARAWQAEQAPDDLPDLAPNANSGEPGPGAPAPEGGRQSDPGADESGPEAGLGAGAGAGGVPEPVAGAEAATAPQQSSLDPPPRPIYKPKKKPPPPDPWKPFQLQQF